MGKNVGSGSNTYDHNKDKSHLLKNDNTEQLIQTFRRISVRILMRHCANGKWDCTEHIFYQELC